jgi:hypothetical protein
MQRSEYQQRRAGEAAEQHGSGADTVVGAAAAALQSS